jgi:hypothetical protein
LLLQPAGTRPTPRSINRARWQLGDLGNVVGWPLYINGMILTGNVSGLLTGEWSGASAAAKRWMGAGVAVLFASVVVIGYGNAS